MGVQLLCGVGNITAAALFGTSSEDMFFGVTVACLPEAKAARKRDHLSFRHIALQYVCVVMHESSNSTLEATYLS